MRELVLGNTGTSGNENNGGLLAGKNMHNMPASGIDLLEKMVVYDPLKRITSKAALNHEFFADLDPNDHEAVNVPAIPMTRERRAMLEKSNGSDPLSEIPAFRTESKFNAQN